MKEQERANVNILMLDADLAQSEIKLLLDYVSVEKRKRVKLFRHVRDAQVTLLGDIMARIELSKMTGLSNNQLSFFKNEFGKPFLSNVIDIHYNISHSGVYVVCAVSNTQIGVDIELIKSIDINIAKRFFSPDEINYVFYPSDEQQYERFYQIWTMKESQVKWEGMGLSKNLRSFSVLKAQKNTPPFYYRAYKSREAICYVCTSSINEPIVNHISVGELLEMVSTLKRL